MRKKLSLIALIALMVFALIGCSKNEQATATSSAQTSQASAPAASPSQDTKAEAAPAEEEPRSYTMFMRGQYVRWLKDLKWYDVAEERTGIHVEYIEGPVDTDATFNEVDQRLASGTLPDATMLKLAQAKVYGTQGAFVDLKPYIEARAPHIQAYIDAHPDYEKLITADDGGIYAIVSEAPQLVDLIGYRADHFRKAGIDPLQVRTVEDFTNAMRTLKAYYGKDNPNYYPLSGRYSSALRFGFMFGAAAYVDETGSEGIYYGHEKDTGIGTCFNIKADGAYAMTETMKTWYEEGLINPSWVDGTNTEGDWESQMLSGNASIFVDFYNRADWFMSNGGPENDPDYDMQVLDFLVDENGNKLKQTSSVLWDSTKAFAVNINCDEETINTFIDFMDYFYTDEGIILTNWGVEGESFKYNEDGSKSFIADYTAEETKPEGTKKWSFLSDRTTVCKPVDQEAFYAWNTPLTAEAAARCINEENVLDRPVIVYTTEQEQRISNLVATVYNSEVSGLVSFIVGNTPLNQDTWNAFVEQMDALGLQEIEDIQYEAYKATFGI